MRKGAKHTEEVRKTISDKLKGRKLSEETRKRMSQSRVGKMNFPKPKGEKSALWKSDNITYGRMHDWVRESWGSANRCEHCETKTAKIYDWANISQEYHRERNDWKQLCRKCHDIFDNRYEKLSITNKGMASNRKGAKLSEETKTKMSIAQMLRRRG